MSVNSEFDRARGSRIMDVLPTRYPKMIIFSIISTFVWMGFNMFWIAFLWSKFSFFQNIVLLGIVFLAFSVLNALVCLIVQD